MPHFLHQWSYHDRQVRAIVTEQQDRQEVVRVAAEAFGGRLLQFYFCFGEYDGVAISEFKDQETALACLMVIIGQGSVRQLKTTPLIQIDEMQRATQLAHQITHGG